MAVNYLKFTAKTAGSTIMLKRNTTSAPNLTTLQYSTDGTTWTNLSFNAVTRQTQTVTLTNIGDSVMFRNTGTTFSSSGSNYIHFVMTGSLDGSGSIMTLIDQTDALRDFSGKDNCFNHLFYKCTSLETLPDLPATTFGTATGVYNGLCRLATNIKNVPVLAIADSSAETVAANMFEMFADATGIEKITSSLPASALDGSQTLNWLPASSAGEWNATSFEFDQTAVSRTADGIPAGWTIKVPAEPNYFRISRPASGAGSLTIKFTLPGSSQITRQIKYRVVGGPGTWYDCINTALSLAVGAAIEFKCDSDGFYESDTDRVYLEITAGRGASGQVDIGGDITTLLNSTTGNVTDLTGKDYCFAKLFVCQSTKISHNFDNLVLPSTTLAKGCYWQMFAGVTGSTVHGEQEPGCAFVLPAQTLAQDAYKEMFSGTAQLVKIKAGVKSDQLNATNSQDWLKNVAASGVFESTDASFNTSIERSATTVPSGWTITKPEPTGGGFFLNGKEVKTLAINGKFVKTLYIDGKQVDFEGPEPPGPDPKETNFRITNIGNATDNPDDTWAVQFYLPRECEMEVYHSDSGNTETLTSGQITTLTLPYGEYLEFEGDNQNGLYPMDTPVHITCPEDGAYEASGQLSSLAKLDTKEVGYSFYGLFEDNTGLVKADNLVLPGGYDGLEETFNKMFQGCSNLVKGPENMPSADGSNQFADMFNSCVKLESIGVDWTTWPVDAEATVTTNWLADAGTSAAKTPTFKCPATLTIPDRGSDYVPLGWNITHA